MKENKKKIKIFIKHGSSVNVNKKNILFWGLPIYNHILKQTQALQFLMGASAENTKNKWLSAVYFSKNNVDIFNWNFVRVKSFGFFSIFRWIKKFSFTTMFNKEIKIMFASRTPVFANLMEWAGNLTDSAYSSNRWLNGNISAQIKLKLIPGFLFMPDPEENQMILNEAFNKKIVIITITNSDSVFEGDIVLFGNNRSFKYTSQIVEMIIRCLKHKHFKSNFNKMQLPSYKTWFLNKKNN